jgi:hypothetical protein
MAASATFALKAGLWFLRGRFIVSAPIKTASNGSSSITYRPVQFSGASSKAAVQRRELYDGKKIIDEFFRRHLHDSGMSKEIFVYSCAKEASSRHSVSEFIQALFAALGILPPQPSAAKPPVAGDALEAVRA